VAAAAAAHHGLIGFIAHLTSEAQKPTPLHLPEPLAAQEQVQVGEMAAGAATAHSVLVLASRPATAAAADQAARLLRPVLVAAALDCLVLAAMRLVSLRAQPEQTAASLGLQTAALLHHNPILEEEAERVQPPLRVPPMAEGRQSLVAEVGVVAAGKPPLQHTLTVPLVVNLALTCLTRLLAAQAQAWSTDTPEEQPHWASRGVAVEAALVTLQQPDRVAQVASPVAALVVAEHQSQVARLVPVEQGAVA